MDWGNVKLMYSQETELAGYGFSSDRDLLNSSFTDGSPNTTQMLFWNNSENVLVNYKKHSLACSKLYPPKIYDCISFFA